MSKSNIIPLDWSVEVRCSGGWKIKARFSDEAAAWAYGQSQLQARIYYNGECLGQRESGIAGGSWQSSEKFLRLKEAHDDAAQNRRLTEAQIVPRNRSEKYLVRDAVMAYARVALESVPDISGRGTLWHERQMAWFALHRLDAKEALIYTHGTAKNLRRIRERYGTIDGT